MRALWIAFLTACATAPLGPAQPLMPVPGARIVSHRPRFLWSRKTTAQIDLCRDADCKQLIQSFVASGNSADSPVDLPLGECYWRFREAGQPPAKPRLLNVDVRIRLDGRFTILEVPESERAIGERVSALADRAIEFLSGYFGAAPPKEKLRIVTYVTPGALGIIYGDAEHSYLGKTQSDETHALEVEMPLLSGPAEQRHGAGRFDAIVVHEIAHAFQFRSFFNYRDLPIWWVEGLAELLATKIVGSENVQFASRMDTARRRLLAPGKMSLRALSYATEENFRDPSNEGLNYAAAYTVLFAAEKKDPKKFQSLVRQISTMPKLPPFVVVINERILGALGGAAQLEQDWRAAVLHQDLWPWQQQWGELRKTAADRFELESVRGHIALALSSRDGFSPVSFTGRARAVGIALAGGKGALELVLVPFDGIAALRTETNNRLSEVVTRGERVSLGGGEHRIGLAPQGDQVVVLMDDQAVLKFDHHGPIAPWGVLVDDGLIELH